MTQEEIKYTIAADANGNPGSRVDLVVSYDESQPIHLYHEYDPPYYRVTGATGTYETLDASGNVIHTDTVTGVVDPGGFGDNDNLIQFRGEGLTVFDGNGLSFTVSDPSDSNDGAGDVNFFGISATTYSEAGQNHNETSDVTLTPVCFAEGTRIRTARGDIEVEALRIGDEVITSAGQYRPIRWLGHRRVECRRAADPQSLYPIRIVAGAFGQGRPARDLFVSPHHALCVTCIDEVFVPARVLVNGATIDVVEVDAVTYWHVELDSHDVLLAEGLPAESYMETGNRAFFSTGDGAIESDSSERTYLDFCRPFVAEGALVQAVRDRLRARSASLGWMLDASPYAGLHAVVEGRTIAPQTDGLTVAFAIPAGASEVRLVSRVAVPSEFGENSDFRRLGVAIQALSVADAAGERRAIAIDHPLLDRGFHNVEGDGDRRFRWTSGQAVVPTSLWGGCGGEMSLSIELFSPSLPCWAPPVDAPTALPRSLSRRQRATPSLVLVGNRAA